MFVRDDKHLDRVLTDPQIAADVAEANTAAAEMDRVYAMNLAMICRGTCATAQPRRPGRDQVSRSPATARRTAAIFLASRLSGCLLRR